MRSRKPGLRQFYRILPPLIFTLILLGSILLLKFLPVTTAFNAEIYIHLGYFSAYLAVLVSVFSIREASRSGLSELYFWGGGFAVFAFLLIARNAVIAFSEHEFLNSGLPVASAGFDVAATFLLAIYFLIGAWSGRRFDGKNLVLAPAAGVIVVSAATALILFPAPTLATNNDNSTMTFLFYLASALLVFASVIFLLRRRFRHNDWASNWLISAFSLAGFVDLYSALSNNPGDIFFYAALFGNPVFLSFCGFGIFANKNKRLSINQDISEVLQTGVKNPVMGKRAYNDMIENMTEGVILLDLNNTIKYCNSTFAYMFGYDPEKVPGLHLSVFLKTENFQRVPPELAVSEEQNSRTIELDFRNKNNDSIPVRLHIVPIRDAYAKIVGSQYVVSDLSEQKRIEQQWQQQTEEKHRRLEVFRECTDHSTEGILIADATGQIIYVNLALEIMTGYDRAELVGKNTAILCHGTRSELVHEKIWNSVKVGKIWRGEFNTRKKDSSSFVGELAVVPIKNEKVAIGHYLWIEYDITRRKTLEKSLQNYANELTQKTDELESSKSYYGSLISAMSDILLVVDNDGRCTFINSYGKKRLGYTADELSRLNLPIFFDDLKKLESDYGQAIQVEIKDFECVIKPKEGEAILCSWYARPLFDRYNQRVGAMAVGRDITGHKKMQNKLEDYAKNLEKSVEDRTLELEKKLTQLGKLLEIGEEIRLNGDVDVIINKICEAVQALGWRKVVISLRDYEKQVSQPVATAGLPPEQVEKVMSWRDIPFEHTDKYFKEHFRISHSYFIPGEEEYVTEDTPYSVYSKLNNTDGEWNSMDALLVPIRTRDKVLGTISVDDPENKKRPGFDEVRDLEIFADKAAIAIENVRLFQVQKENEREAKFLADISKIFHASLNLDEVLEAVVEKGGTTIGEFCTLLLAGKNKDRLLPEATFHNNPRIVDLFVKGTEEFPCKIHEGIIGTVVSSGKACKISTPAAGGNNGFTGTIFHYLEESFPITSLMVVPLKAPGKIIGAMAYILFDGKRKYRSEELRLSQELASRAALAIENARLFQEAGEKARELEKANRMKSEFLANVSHELRTPLNAIITLSDILMHSLEDFSQEEQSKQLEIIHRSGRNLLNLINDILDLAKIESGKVEPAYSDIMISAVVEETIEHIRPLCIKKGLTLDYQRDKATPKTIYSDQDKLTKAITNILGNAVKFTRKGGITVYLGMRDKKTIALSISDTGIGIPVDRIDEMFQEFHQIDSSDSRNYGGTGLGLAITKRVLDIIGGKVTVKSQPGKGSIFTITIPVKSKKDLQEEQILDERLLSLPASMEPTVLDIQDDRENLDSAKRTIVVCDDEMDSRYVISRYLRANDFQVIFPGETEDIIELIKQHHPYAITLDIIMPHKSGWEVLKELKDNPDTREVSVIVATILRERERALESGASAFIIKPITPEVLLAALDDLENSREKKSPRFEIPKLWGLRKKWRKPNQKTANGMNANSNRNRILLVDDDKDTQYAMRLILEGAGYHVHFASEGREALRKAEAVLPNLILMDLMMPGMDGYEATRALKAQEQFRKIPIVAMTAKAMKGDREQTIQAGCDDYIAKPFVTDDILKLIHKWLAAAGTE